MWSYGLRTPTRKDGVPEFVIKPPYMSSSGVVIPLVKLQVYIG